MITDKNIINDEIARISNRQGAYLPISHEYFEERFPSGPDGLIMVEGEDGEDMVQRVWMALSEISNMPLEEVCSFTDGPFFRLNEIAAIDNCLSTLDARNYRYGLGLSGLGGDKGRISVFFRKRSSAPRSDAIMPNRRGTVLQDGLWQRVKRRARDIYNAEQNGAWDSRPGDTPE